MATVKKNDNSADRLLDLPFDQYSRQYLVRELVDAVLRRPKQRLSIIDLGGHKGKTGVFFPRDSVTILDVFDETYGGYVKGDATNMTFADNSFDIACSFDVFEHIPRSKRQKFVTEALRVSKLGIFIAMPVDDKQGAVSHAEKTLNNLHHTLYGEDHRWLKEHIDYRIPNEAEVASLLKKAGGHFVMLSSNQITDWQLLQMVIFVAARNPLATGPAQKLNEWYNQHLSELERGVSLGYRRIYFVAEDKALCDRVQAAVNQLASTPVSEEAHYIPVHQTVLEKTLQAVAATSSSFLAILQQKEAAEVVRTKEVADLHEKLKKEVDTNVELQGQLASVYASTSWRITSPLRALMNVLRKIR